MARAAYTEDADLSLVLTQAIRATCGGIAPHKNGKETDEYRRNVPVWLRSKQGLPADQVAQVLATHHPALGIESESDLYRALSDGATQRMHNGTEHGYTEPGDAATSESQQAREKLQDFAWALEQLDARMVEQLRQAWKDAYGAVGHKALARYLLTADIRQASRGLEKRYGMAL